MSCGFTKAYALGDALACAGNEPSWNFSSRPDEPPLGSKHLSATCSYPIEFSKHPINKMLNPTRLALIVMAALTAPIGAQVFDNTGNGMLNGKYYFREVLLTSTDDVAVY